MRVRVYVDGFNLYYGCREVAGIQEKTTGTRVVWKWLDVEALVDNVTRTFWPAATLDKVYYFTAPVKQRWPGDTAGNEQDVYLRALKRRDIEVVPGRFIVKTIRRPLVDPQGEIVPAPNGRAQMANVRNYEEKGSDVNLATTLLIEHFLQQPPFDGSVVVSADSDLDRPVIWLRNAGWPVGLINPRRYPLPKLWPADLQPPHFGYRLEVADLVAAQLPNPLTDKAGNVLRSKKGSLLQCPPAWR